AADGSHGKEGVICRLRRSKSSDAGFATPQAAITWSHGMFTRIYEQIAADYVNLTAAIISLVVLVAGAAYVAISPRLFLLGLKNLRRKFLLTALTGAAIGFLALMITLIWTLIYFIDLITVERSKDFKVIITYKWSVPSQLPMTHANYLDPRQPDSL